MCAVSSFLPVLELSRGKAVESVHYGAVAVVDVGNNLVAWYGDPEAVSYLRSSAKPFQILPLLERGGRETYELSLREIAIICASHSGTDEHVEVIRAIQNKIGVSEADLLCGVHYPIHEQTSQLLRDRGEQPTPNRHNCSGKHTGMLALARMMDGLDVDDLPYIDFTHSVQQAILRTFAEMCDLPVDNISIGIDGCSAPNFAVPLRSAALAYAKLCDPEYAGNLKAERIAACKTVQSAMISHPDMVGGPGRFDTLLMEVGDGRILCKGGAEAFQGIGLMPGALGPGSPALGIAIKISDGDPKSRARPSVAIEVLKQLGALSANELEKLSVFGPCLPVLNWRKIVAGESHPIFTLQWNNEIYASLSTA